MNGWMYSGSQQGVPESSEIWSFTRLIEKNRWHSPSLHLALFIRTLDFTSTYQKNSYRSVPAHLFWLTLYKGPIKSSSKKSHLRNSLCIQLTQLLAPQPTPTLPRVAARDGRVRSRPRSAPVVVFFWWKRCFCWKHSEGAVWGGGCLLKGSLHKGW